jgi:hypothetical protein
VLLASRTYKLFELDFGNLLQKRRIKEAFSNSSKVRVVALVQSQFSSWPFVLKTSVTKAVIKNFFSFSFSDNGHLT